MSLNLVQHGGELLCNLSVAGMMANSWTIEGKHEYRSKWWYRHTNKETHSSLIKFIWVLCFPVKDSRQWNNKMYWFYASMVYSILMFSNHNHEEIRIFRLPHLSEWRKGTYCLRRDKQLVLLFQWTAESVSINRYASKHIRVFICGRYQLNPPWIWLSSGNMLPWCSSWVSCSVNMDGFTIRDPGD